MKISLTVGALLNDIIHGEPEVRDYLLCCVGDVVAARGVDEALSVSRWFLEQIRLSHLDPALLLGALQEVIRKYRDHPLFVDTVRQYENESGLIFMTAEDDRAKRQARSSLNDVKRPFCAQETRSVRSFIA